jgi:hypothetical protein
MKPARLALRIGLGALLASSIVTGCAGDTGSQRFSFEAKIRGTRAESSTGYTFTNETGWSVSLTRASVTLGPVYLNVIPPLRGSATSWMDLLIRPAFAHGEGHLDSGRIVGEVLAQVTFDALSDEFTAFPVRGTVTQEQVRTAEIWFYPEPGTPADAKKIDTVALEVAGEAQRGAESVPFRGTLQLSDAWLADQTAGTRGNQSITGIRQVRGVPATFFPGVGGELQLTFDVKRLFRGANFSNLAKNPTDKDGTKVLLPGKAGDQVMTNLYQGLREVDQTYSVRWVSP